MDIVLNRRGGVSIRDQLVTQIELQILGGQLQPGEKLPSVRALARQLRLHANTVSSAYRALRASGLLQMRRGSGIYVASGGPSCFEDARNLDEMIRLALQTALRRGFSADLIRAATARWMTAEPPDRLVVVDPAPEAGTLLARELEDALQLPVSTLSPDALRRDSHALDGALGLALPYHVEQLRTEFAEDSFEVLHLGVRDEDRAVVHRLPAGSIVLVVSSMHHLLPFASSLVRSLRGDEVLIETATLENRAHWTRLCRAADLVMADVLAFPAVQKIGPKRIHELRLISETTIAYLRSAMDFVVPGSRPQPPAALKPKRAKKR